MAKNTAEKETVTTETMTQPAAEITDAPAPPSAPAPEIAAVPADPALAIEELFVERDPSDKDPNVVIGINGKNWVMPRGEIAHVPKFVADEYRRARDAQYKADKAAAEMRGIKEAK